MKTTLIIILILLSCGCKSTFCPEFPKVLTCYFPYEDVQIIKFKNSTNDTVAFSLITYDISGSYDIKWNCKCGCDSRLDYFMESDSSLQLNIEGSLGYYFDGSSSELVCKFSSKEFDDRFYFSKIFDDQSITDSNELLGDTININDESNYRYTEVTIVKNEGIVQFWDKEMNDYWVKL